MQPSPLLLIVSALALFGVSALIAIRLLCLAWKTGEVPERPMGLGLGSLLFVYFPVMATTGMGRVPTGEVDLARLALVSPFFVGGFACLVCFTWRVCRPNDGWAVVLSFTLATAAAGMIGGMMAAAHSVSPDTDSFASGQLWSGLLRLPMTVAFAWSGIEGAVAHARARRRLELGLIDPVVANRFLLWAIVGFAQVALQSVTTVLHFEGERMMASSIGLFVVSIGASVGSGAMWLVLPPPRAYLRSIERRAGSAIV